MQQQKSCEGHLYLLGGDNLRFLVEEPVQAHFDHLKVVYLGSWRDFLNVVDEAVNQCLPACLLVEAGKLAEEVFGWVVNRENQYAWLSVVVLGHPNARLPSCGSLPQLVERVGILHYPFTQKAAMDAVKKSVWWSYNLCRMMDRVKYFENLTERELAIVSMATDGVPNKSMARRLEVSIKTIEKNRRTAYGKLHVSSGAEMAALVTFRRYFNSPVSSGDATSLRMHNQKFHGSNVLPPR